MNNTETTPFRFSLQKISSIFDLSINPSEQSGHSISKGGKKSTLRKIQNDNICATE